MTQSPDTIHTISHAEARDVARRLIAGDFRRNGERLDYDVGPRFSIPTRPDQDDDCLIVAYIEQREAADLVAAHEAEEARLAAAGRTMRSALLAMANVPIAARMPMIAAAMIEAFPDELAEVMASEAAS